MRKQYGTILCVEFLIAAAILMAPVKPAHGSETDWDSIGETDLAKAAKWVSEKMEQLWVYQDPVRRTIACRVGYGSFSMKTLMQATHYSYDRVYKAVMELRNHGLVRNEGQDLFGPAGGAAAEKLKRWAREYCENYKQCSDERA